VTVHDSEAWQVVDLLLQLHPSTLVSLMTLCVRSIVAIFLVPN